MYAGPDEGTSKIAKTNASVFEIWMSLKGYRSKSLIGQDWNYHIFSSLCVLLSVHIHILLVYEMTVNTSHMEMTNFHVSDIPLGLLIT